MSARFPATPPRSTETPGGRRGSASRTGALAAALLATVSCLGAGCGKGRETAEPPLSGEAAGRARLFAVLPSIARVGEPTPLHVAVLDDIGMPAPPGSGTLRLTSTDPGLSTSGPLDPGNGSVSTTVTFRAPGIHRITVTGAAGETAVAGPVRAVATAEELRTRPGEATHRLLWGDAHGHTDVGDGLSPPESFLSYGRDVARLDWTCVSEHDFEPLLETGLDRQEGSWEHLVAMAREWRRPGFAILLGWEWSSREHGHRVVLVPDGDPRYVSHRGAATPADLAAALRGTGALSVIAHPTGSELTPNVNWETVVPGFDRAIEIYSGHGGMDESGFRPPPDPRPGCSAIDAIRRGLDLAIVAFSDTHLSTPGNPWPPPIRDAPYRGGLTAVLSDGASERDVLEALRAGRCYATSGERFYLEFRVGDRTLGETLVVGPGQPVRVHALAAAVGAIDWLEILADDRAILRRTDGRPDLEVEEDVGPFAKDVALWMRGASTAGERFWTTPVRVVRS